MMLSELLEFLEIDDQTKRYAPQLWQVLAPHADEIIDAFYRKVEDSHIHSHITPATVERLKQAQKKHWTALFSSSCDDDYAAGVRRVAFRHREINLSLAWYVAGYAAIKIEFINVIVHSDYPVATKGHLIRTLEKYVALDTALALSVHDMAVVD
jgi:hypothetical protein